MAKANTSVKYLWRFTAFDNRRSKAEGKYINRTIYVEAVDETVAVELALQQLGNQRRYYNIDHRASKMAEKIAEGVYDNYGKAK